MFSGMVRLLRSTQVLLAVLCFVSVVLCLMIYLPTRFISTAPTVIQQHASLYLTGTSNVTEDISTLHNNNGSAISSYSKTQTVGVPAAHEPVGVGGGTGLVPITLSTLTNVSSTSAKAKYSDVQSSTAGN